MYLEHYGLKDLPFRITPDTSFFFKLASHHEALNVLVVALRAGEGFIKITGEVGTGKTLLCRKLLNMLGDKFVTAYIPNPFLTPETLRMALAEELGLRFPRNITQHELLQLITSKLVALNASGKRAVLCLDEAQALPQDSLEALRLLTNLETEKRKLLQVVLFGQPELDIRLKDPAVRQLKQRITFSYELTPMGQRNVAAYIDYRLRVAGYKGSPLFTQRAVKDIHHASRGIPRLVNVLAHKSLMLGFGKGTYQVDRPQARLAIRDTEGAHLDWRLRFLKLLFHT